MNKLKKIGIGFLATTMLLSSTSVMAKEGKEDINVSFNNTKVYVGSTQVTVGSEPFVYDGKTYMAVEDIAKALGYTVVKDASSQTISFKQVTTNEVGLTKEGIKQDNSIRS